METPPRNDLRDYQRRARRVAGRGANRPERPFRERKLVAGVSTGWSESRPVRGHGTFPEAVSQGAFPPLLPVLRFGQPWC